MSSHEFCPNEMHAECRPRFHFVTCSLVLLHGNFFDVSVQDQVPQGAAATAATAATATVLLLVLGPAVAATMAILPLQEPGTQARTAVKAALSQAAMEEMVATAVPLAVSLLIVYIVRPCIKLTPQPLSVDT